MGLMMVVIIDTVYAQIHQLWELIFLMTNNPFIKILSFIVLVLGIRKWRNSFKNRKLDEIKGSVLIYDSLL